MKLCVFTSFCVLSVTTFTWPIHRNGRSKQQSNSSQKHRQELFVSIGTNTQTSTILDEYDNDGLKERLRNAYMRWCTLHNKHYDETRLDIFSSRYLQAERHAQHTGVSIQLNEFAAPFL